MCLNRKVLIGLGVLALGVFAFDPAFLDRAFPWLLFAVCPLSMVFMMLGMRRAGRMQGMSSRGQSYGLASGSVGSMGVGSNDMRQAGTAGPGPAAVEDEVARLRAEVDQLRAERTTRTQGVADTW
jgi:hypothetical protein